MAAEFDEVGAFEGGAGEEDAVVGYYADFLAVDVGEAGYEGGAEVAFEFGEDAAVDYPSYDFVDWKWAAEVGTCYAE